MEEMVCVDPSTHRTIQRGLALSEEIMKTEWSEISCSSQDDGSFAADSFDGSATAAGSAVASSASEAFFNSLFNPFVDSVFDSPAGAEDGTSGLLGSSGIEGGIPDPGNGETGERAGSSFNGSVGISIEGLPLVWFTPVGERA